MPYHRPGARTPDLAQGPALRAPNLNVVKAHAPTSRILTEFRAPLSFSPISSRSCSSITTIVKARGTPGQLNCCCGCCQPFLDSIFRSRTPGTHSLTFDEIVSSIPSCNTYTRSRVPCHANLFTLKLASDLRRQIRKRPRSMRNSRGGILRRWAFIQV